MDYSYTRAHDLRFYAARFLLSWIKFIHLYFYVSHCCDHCLLFRRKAINLEELWTSRKFLTRALFGLFPKESSRMEKSTHSKFSAQYTASREKNHKAKKPAPGPLPTLALNETVSSSNLWMNMGSLVPYQFFREIGEHPTYLMSAYGLDC